MRWWQWLIGLFALVFGLSAVNGCAINDILKSGPEAMKQSADINKTLVLHATDGLKAAGGEMSVTGKMEDPTYTMEMFFGTGVYSKVQLGLRGIEIGGQLMAHLKERLESDPALRGELIAILRNTELSAERKEAMILQLLGKVWDDLTKKKEAEATDFAASALGTNGVEDPFFNDRVPD